MKKLLAVFCLLTLAGCHKPAPKYREGDIVRMKIGKMRGQILRRECNFKNCVYRARFPVASMNDEWVLEYEIEKAPSPSISN